MPRDPACLICGQKPEQPGRRVCYGCHLDGLVPGDYRFREGYHFDEVWGHMNASARPATGVRLLDLERPPRLCDTYVKVEILKRLCAMEARQGLSAREVDRDG